MQASDFLGLSKFSAQDKAEKIYWIFRLVSVDGERFLGYPDPKDIRNDRICVEIKNGIVVKAAVN